MTVKVVVDTADFNAGEEIQRVQQLADSIGGVASFIGCMRSNNDGRRVQAMSLEHYPGMTEKSLQKIVDEACKRWQLQGATVIHRVGEFVPGDQIVLVVTAAAHRGEAFAACEFIMDYLKTRAPFWKKECTDEGDFWVEARDSDGQAADRW
ncbi:molybdopterin synthase catalytic subunit [Litorivivens lipolytica]|uniref:Molybdopterin synthase catalytic subunit n=1 Tax=Litorivivens lipolytica TaxID=1524264 RepID=A0A7W4W3A1_9GAMM|nr:molybdopterin synthase catalytic subunit MoaE [Litorivivens lipolytica]MBB3046660.1 molybdopterin synthase catalytic subunit [Litorivivens lipolytica]